MAQATLQEMAREVHLYSGEVLPIMLAQRFIRDRYRKVCERQLWSFKLGRGTFGVPDSYSTGTLTATYNSTTITGSGTTWTSSHVGQQLKVEGFVFTITAVASGTSLTIDMKWLGTTGSSKTYEIVQAYITPTDLYSDFHAFHSVSDPTNGWLLHLAFNSKDLDRIDARRSASGTPRVLANGVYNSSNKATFEIWPHSSTQKQYLYTYEKRLADLATSDTPPSIIRSDVLVKGALADLARWPGTPERKNPLYDPYFNQWKVRESEFEQEVAKLIVEDQSIFQTDLSWGHGLNYAPLDAKYMQSHAF